MRLRNTNASTVRKAGCYMPAHAFSTSTPKSRAEGSSPSAPAKVTHLKRCHTEKALEIRGFLAFKRPSNALCAYAPTTVTAWRVLGGCQRHCLRQVFDLGIWTCVVDKQRVRAEEKQNIFWEGPERNLWSLFCVLREKERLTIKSQALKWRMVVKR